VKILVTGGRDYEDYDKFCQVMDRFSPESRQYRFEQVTHIIHGGAKGADAMADRWARDNGVQPVRVDALWDIHGRAAGPIRNKAMLDLLDKKDDGVIAFPGGAGTASMVAIAQAAGVQVQTSGMILGWD